MKQPFSKRLTTAAITTVFTVTSVMAVMPPPVHAAEDEESWLYTDEGYAYIVNDDGNITIKGFDKDKEFPKERIVLPSTIDGKLVTEIDSSAFGHGVYSSNSTVTEIVLPDHIEKINNWCFNDYKALDTLVIPKTLKKAERPFTYCKINKVIIEDGMEKIPDWLFSSTDYMGEIVIPDSVTAIGDNAFEAVTGLKEIHVPDSVKSIGRCAISDNPDLEVLDLPDVLDFVGSYAFEQNPKLTSVTVPDTWTFGEDTEGHFFQKCGLKEITFEGDRDVIPDGICGYCESLEKINWSNAPKKIGSRAFEDCVLLTDPKIPDTVEVIDSYAFSGCKGITHLDLPTSIKELNNRSFEYLENLKYLYVPVDLEPSGRYFEVSAFWGSGIQELVFADGVTKLTAKTSGLPYLTKVTIPDTVTLIQAYSFNGDKALAEIKLPDSVTHIEYQSVFSDCNNLKELTIPPLVDGADGCLGSAPALEVVRFSEGMETIPEGMCSFCEKLKKAYIPESVTYISNKAFNRCYELEELDMKQESIKFGYQAFDRCDRLFDERVSFVKEGDLFMTKSVVSPEAGGITNYTLYYSINPRFLDSFNTAHVSVSTYLAENVLIEESLPEGISTGRFGFDMDLGQTSGVVRFSVRNPEDKEFEVAAEFSAKVNPDYPNSADTKRIVASQCDFKPITINVPDTVGSSDGKANFDVYGVTTPDADVSILINGEEFTKVKSNGYTGKYSAAIEYANTENEITVQAICGELKSDKRTVRVDSSMPILSDAKISHVAHDKWELDATDMFTKGATPFVMYNPGHTIEFDVALDNDDNVDKAFVFSESGDKVSAIPLEKDPETGRYTGEGKFDSTLPGDMYIGQVPKSETGKAFKKTTDVGKVALEKDGIDLLGTSPKNLDPVKEFVENGKITVEEATPEISRVKAKYPLGPCLPPYWEGPDEIEINIVQYISDDINLDGKKVSAIDAAKAPEEHGFTKSGVTLVEEDGEEYTYYARYLTTADEVNDAAKNIKTSSGTADKFLNDGTAEASGGLVMLKVSNKTGEPKVETQLFGDNEKFLAKDQVGGATLSIIADASAEGAKKTISRAAAIVGIVNGVFDIWDAYNNSSMDIEQIEYSKNSYVQEHREELKARTKNAFYGKVVLTVGAVALGTVVTLTTAIPLAIGIALSAAIGVGAYLLNRFFITPYENETRSKIYVSGKGNINCGIDPSGYVYAAVPDNRIKGATATIYYKDDSGAAVKWNAEDYDQVNPQITDSAGRFAWDVPEGMWQVVISAEGYEDYKTEWLPVLPVQTDINISLKSTAAPALGTVDAFANGVEVSFSQYMDDSTATAENIYLTDASGNKINCRIKPVKSETNGTEYSDRILLISDKENIAGSTLHITGGLLSYSGVAATPTESKITEVKDELIVDENDSLGDVNADGKVDAKDASLVLVYYSKMSTGAEGNFTDAQKSAANVNSDSLIDAKDASFILAYYSIASTATSEVPTMSEFMKPKAA